MKNSDGTSMGWARVGNITCAERTAWAAVRVAVRTMRETTGRQDNLRQQRNSGRRPAIAPERESECLEMGFSWFLPLLSQNGEGVASSIRP